MGKIAWWYISPTIIQFSHTFTSWTPSAICFNLTYYIINISYKLFHIVGVSSEY